MGFTAAFRLTSASLALVLLSSFATVAAPVEPAFAALGDQGGLTLSKLVDSESSIVDVEPGDSFTYDITIGCDDNNCIEAALTDQLPAEFAGFILGDVSVSPSAATGYDLQLTGGCAENAPLVAGCGIAINFLQQLGTLGGVEQVGIIAGTTFRVSYSLTAPLTLQPDWAYNGVAVPNKAELTATNALPRESTASVTVQVPVVLDAAVTKNWSPASQQYGPGSSSTVTTEISNTSNVSANSLTIQDPSIAVDGAAELPASNPFTRVNFDDLCGVTLPTGASQMQVDAYYFDSGTWNWVDGTPGASTALPAAVTDPSNVGGVRVTYSSTASGDQITADGDAGELCFTVKQRTTDRTSGAALVSGGEIGNVALGTVRATDQDPVTRNASAALNIAGLTVDVTAGKQITPGKVPASGEFAVSLTGKNASSGTLSSLTIAEPGPGAASFLSDDLVFTGFTAHTWPTGATSANFVWNLKNSGPAAPIELTSGTLPELPTLMGTDFITGFTVTYDGEIVPGTTAGWDFTANADAEMDIDGSSDTYSNVVGVSGTNAAGTATDEATAPVEVFTPDIDIALDKTLSPQLNTPGGTAVMSLEAATSSGSQYVRPDTIVVEDVWDGTAATSFWDAYRPQEIVFTDVPADSSLQIEYATGTPSALTWQALPGSPTAAMINSLPVPSNAVGLRFTYTNVNGFGQGTTVKPNVVFTASPTLRDGSTVTSVAGESATRYFNKATAQGIGTAGPDTVTSALATDTDDIDVIVFDGTGPGTLLASKRWVTSNWTSDLTALSSQSGATARTLLGWGVTTPGYDSAVISDAAAGSESTPATTVYQAFDLTRIMPITYAVDPLLRWDVVTKVELYRGGSWQEVTQPTGGWMDSNGFRGYPLTEPEQDATTGVSITVAENTSARDASTDPTRPASNSGVASSATERHLRLEWSLRNTLRVPISSVEKWVNEDVAYNQPGNGVVLNTFGLAATAGSTTTTRVASDTIGLVDTTPNVNTRKTASEPWVTVPHFGDVAPENYPTVDFTVEAWNTASARASYLRSADPFPCTTGGSCITAANDFSPNVYGGASYDALTSPFERFTLTGLSFSTPTATNIDRDASGVALWLRDAQGDLTVQHLSITAAEALSATQLADAVGVSVVYQSTDPQTTGGLIPRQNTDEAHPTMTLSTQLRTTLRSQPSELVNSGVTVANVTNAQSFDPVLTPSGDASTPNAAAQADVELRVGDLDVTASKSISPGTIIEANADTPITVTLGATSGESTLGAQTVTIRDIAPEFWASFSLASLGSAALPAANTRVRVDVQVNGDPTWVAGTAGTTAVLPASVTDLSEITGIQFVFDRADGKPFSDTVPAADWSASAMFTAVLRDGATFPGSVDNDMSALAEHDDYEVKKAMAADGVVLSSGTARIDVRKEALTGSATHIVEPGVAIPWTLEFTNTGTGYLDITQVSDNFGSQLEWDGSAPTYATSAGGTLPTTGVVVTQSLFGELEFAWPTTARMQPGEKFTITMNVALLPGLSSMQRATNEFTVSTEQTLTSCTNVSGNQQGTLAGLGDHQCGTSNYVEPLSGALLFAQKTVKGEVDGNLVNGAINIEDPSLPCVADSEGFFRSKCVARTVAGATDTWRMSATNSGTVGYTTVTAVDVLPAIGDKLLATGAARGSTFRTVLKDVSAPGVEVVPAGATTVWEVSTDPLACIGSGVGSDWGTNPTCSTTTWVTGASYVGNAEDITAVRWTVDFAGTSAGVLQPGGTVEFRMDTVNTPLSSSDAISVAVPVGDQIAWNQFGIVATPTSGADIRRAPVQTGVRAQSGALNVTKSVEGAEAEYAPDAFTADVSCSVGGVAVDMGSAGQVTLDAVNGYTARIDGIPLGSTCVTTEDGALGTFGEQERNGPQTVTIVTAGGAEDEVPAEQRATLINTYTVDPTPEPTPTPTPTPEPTTEPTPEPTTEPTAEPTTEPTAEPTSEPTEAPGATASSGALAFTGSQGGGAILLIGLLVLLAGIVLLVVRRKPAGR